MAQLNYRPKEKRLQIAVFALGSFDRREEVRNGGLSELLGFLAKSEFDLESFR